MNRGVLVLLLVATVDRIILQGIYPVLPVMIADFGVLPSYNSIFMAITYLAIALGSYITPRLLNSTVTFNKLSFVLSILTSISLWGMGCSNDYISFLLTTCAYWFLSGVQINIHSIAMSYISMPNNIGGNFGLLANTTLVGAVVGSFALGPFLKIYGVEYSFIVIALFSLVFRLAILLYDFNNLHLIANKKEDFNVSSNLWLLLIVFNAGIMLSFMGRFNLSLIMKDLQFDIQTISYVFAWGALIAFPLPYVFGKLSERISNKILLVVSLLSVVIALAILQSTHSYTGFLLVSFLICIMTYSSRGVIQKILYDMYPLSEQKYAQSLLSSANWVAAILGFVAVSASSGVFNLQQVSFLGCILGILAVVILFFFANR